MNHQIAEYSVRRYRELPMTRERQRAVRAEVRRRYADRLRGAGFYARLKLEWKILRETRREYARFMPSSHAL